MGRDNYHPKGLSSSEKFSWAGCWRGYSAVILADVPLASDIRGGAAPARTVSSDVFSQAGIIQLLCAVLGSFG